MNIRKFIKYGGLLLLLISWGNVAGNDCDAPEEHEAYQRLCRTVEAQKPVGALTLADSLLGVLNTENKAHCALYQWILYQKGEALELMRNRNEEALKLYYDLAKRAEKSKNWELLAQVHISIARIHEPIRRPEDCQRNLNIARKIIKEHNLNAVYAHFALRYSSYHRFFGNKDSARVYALQAIDYGKKYKAQRSELDGNLLMGVLSEDIETSVEYLQNAAEIYLLRNAYYGAATMKVNIASQHIKSKAFDKAAIQLDSAAYFARMVPENYAGFYGIYSWMYKKKAVLFEAQGMLDSAYHYQKKSLEAEERDNYRTNQKEVNEMEITFALEKEQEKLKFEQQRITYLWWGLVLAGLLLFFMAIGHFNNVRKKRFIAEQKDIIAKKNEELNLSLNRQSLLLSEVHHRVKNNLQLVISLLTLQSHKIPDPEIKTHFNDLSNKVHSMALIHEQLYRSGEFERVTLQDYFDDLFSYFKTFSIGDNSTSFELDTGSLELNLETVLPLGIICTELLSNSLKYARVPEKDLSIKLHIHQEKQEMIFLYRDNGPGYPDGILKRKENSIGEMLIRSMVRQLQAEGIASNDNGAVFTLRFKEKQVSSI